MGKRAPTSDRRSAIVAKLPALDEAVRLLAMVSPGVIVMAHTATSYTLGQEAEAALARRLEAATGTRFVTALGSVLEALACLGVQRIAYATPYNAELTDQERAHLTAHGLDVVGVARLQGVTNIYEETQERAYAVGKQADRPDAEAAFLSGTGMPTLAMLQVLKDDLGKSVFSAASAMMWHALRVIGVRSPQHGYGRLMRQT
jgi:maleate isomerase